MSHRVELTTAAARQVRKLPRPAQTRVIAAIAALGDDPRPRGAKRLAGGSTAWRIRVSDCRVIHDVFDSELLVLVVRAGHRREVYGR